MLKIAIHLSKNLLVSKIVADKDEMVDKDIFDWKSKKSEILTKLKNLVNVSKSQNIVITNVLAIRFLNPKAKVVYI